MNDIIFCDTLVRRQKIALQKEIFTYPNGKIKQVDQLDDILEINGISTGWYENGEIEFIKEYSNGKLHGKTETFYENGKIKSIEYYIEDKLVEKKEF